MSFTVRELVGGNANLEVEIADSDENTNDHVTSSQAWTLYACEIDCVNNTGEDTFTRFWDDATAPAVGTDDAEMVLQGNMGERITYRFGQLGQPAGANGAGGGLSVATVTNAGGTGGADSPSGTVKLTIFAKNS